MSQEQVVEQIPEEQPSVGDKIYRNRYFEKMEAESKRPIENEYSLSDELLRNEGVAHFIDYQEPIDKDAIKANVNPDEISATRLNAIQASLLGYYGRILDMDLTPTQLFHIQVNSIINNTSRGKNGWAGYLSKTSKAVSETTLIEKANEFNGNNRKLGLLDKLKGRR